MGEFLSIHWRTILETTLMAWALLVAWRFLGRNVGSRLLAGTLVTLLILLLLSHALRLELVRTFAFFMGVTLVVVFQPEIRRTFVNLGSHRLLSTARENL